MSASTNVKKAFDRIVHALSAHKQAKAILPSFLPPATDAEIAKFEAKRKTRLPEPLVALYKILNGQDEDAANEALGDEIIESGLFPSIESDDLAFLFVPLHILAESMPGPRAILMPGFRRGWIPFGDNFGGDNIVLDLASDDPTKRGRVLQFNHEYGGAYPLAPSFEAYLTHLADGLEKKTIRFDPEFGLSYKKPKDWDDLIDAGKVEYAPELMNEQ